MAARGGHLEVVKLLLESEADVNGTTQVRATAAQGLASSGAFIKQAHSLAHTRYHEVELPICWCLWCWQQVVLCFGSGSEHSREAGRATISHWTVAFLCLACSFACNLHWAYLLVHSCQVWCHPQNPGPM